MSGNLRGLYGRRGLKENLLKDMSIAGPLKKGINDRQFRDLAGKYLTGTSSVFSAATFYDFLSPEHGSKKVHVCNGTACWISGNSEKVRSSLLKEFREDEIGTVSCLGHCHTGNACLSGNELRYTDKDDDRTHSGVRGHGKGGGCYTGTNVSAPVLLAGINNLPGYYSVIRKYSDNFAGALTEIELSGLRGRGGAGFPFHVKLKTSAGIQSDKKYVVCNADEGDPGAFSDKWLLDNRTHSVLFGILATGMIVGADEGILYVRGEYPDTVRKIRSAIEEFYRLEPALTGENISGSGFTFHLFAGQGAYVCGEETSLLNSIEGLRPEVRSRPPFPAVCGLFGKPTIVGNVETFANIWYILGEGGSAYSSIGTERSSGTKLVSLDSAFNRPGLFEVVMGTPLSEILYGLGGGTRYPVKAFQIGGPLGGIVPESKIGDLNLDFESFSDKGFILGHAGLVSIPADFPLIRFMKHLFDFASRESCGKCFPCRLGSRRGYELLEGASERGSKIDKDLFLDLLETMQLGSLCALGGGLSLPVMNLIEYFGEELGEYFHPALVK